MSATNRHQRLVARVMFLGLLAGAGWGCGGVRGAGSSGRATVGVAPVPLTVVGRVDEPDPVGTVTLSFFSVTEDGGLEPWAIVDTVALDEEGRYQVEIAGGLPDPVVVASESPMGLRVAVLDVHGSEPRQLVVPELGLESTVETYAYLRSRHLASWLGRKPAAVLRIAITPELAEALAGATEFELVTDVVLAAFEAALHRADETLALDPAECDEIYGAVVHEMKGIQARMDRSLLDAVSPEGALEIRSSGQRSVLNAFLAQGIDPDRLADAYVVLLETLAAFSHLAGPDGEEPAVTTPGDEPLGADARPLDSHLRLALGLGAR